MPNAIWKSQTLVDQTLSILRFLPGRLFEAMEHMKDMEADLHELENCDYRPDSKLQGKLAATISELHLLKLKVNQCYEKSRDIALECEWEVECDRSKSICTVTGPCEDDD